MHQNHFLKFSIHLSVRKSHKKLQTNIWKIESKPLEKFKHRYTPKIFWDNLCFVALVYNNCKLKLQSKGLSIIVKNINYCQKYQLLIFFFRRVVLRKLFEIRFSYKHCNFSNICLLIKMASKTVTRSTVEEAIFLWVCYYNFVHTFVVSWSLFKFYVTLFYAIISALYHRFKAVTHFKAQEGGASDFKRRG